MTIRVLIYLTSARLRWAYFVVIAVICRISKICFAGCRMQRVWRFALIKNPYNPVKIEGAAPQTIEAEGESLSWQQVMAADSCSKIVINGGTDFAYGLVKEKYERKPKTLNQKP